MGRPALSEMVGTGIKEGLIPRQVDGRGRPLSRRQVSRLRDGASDLVVGPQEIRRYHERHAGIVVWEEKGRTKGVATEDALTSETFEEGFGDLDLSDIAGSSEALPISTPNPGRVLTLLRSTFDGVPIMRLRRNGLIDGGEQKGDEKPTGAENLVFINGETFAEATEVIKVPLLQPSDKKEAQQTVLVQNILALLAPGQILPINGRWIADPSDPSEDLFMYTMPKVEKTPDFDMAVTKSLTGDPSHLLSLIKIPFSDVLEEFRKYEIPLLIDPPQRNFMVTPDGTEAYIELPWVEAEDIINPYTKVAMWAALEHSAELNPRDAEVRAAQMNIMLRRLEASEKQKQHA